MFRVWVLDNCCIVALHFSKLHSLSCQVSVEFWSSFLWEAV